MNMTGGKGLKIGGIILLIVGLILICGAAWAGITYADGLGKQDNIKNELEEMEEAGETNTSVYKENKRRYDENEDLLATKEQAMGICTPLGIILLVLGIILIQRAKKKDKGATQAYPGQPQQGDPYSQQQNPPQQQY
jgi:uncharacterized iron-regulated membrane protein